MESFKANELNVKTLIGTNSVQSIERGENFAFVRVMPPMQFDMDIDLMPICASDEIIALAKVWILTYQFKTVIGVCGTMDGRCAANKPECYFGLGVAYDQQGPRTVEGYETRYLTGIGNLPKRLGVDVDDFYNCSTTNYQIFKDADFIDK